MSCTEFHPFPRLPVEIRLLIWEAAVRPTSRRRAGIQSICIVDYYDLDYDGPNVHAILPSPSYVDRNCCCIAAIPKYDISGMTNVSAYLWDAGLWTACWESRNVIRGSLNMEYWSRKLNGLIRDYYWPFHTNIPPKWQSWEKHRELPVIVHAPSLQQDDGDDWHFVVRPYQDAFKPSMEMISYWTRNMFGLWKSIFREVTFSAGESGSGPIKNLVFDFDSSWNHDWPEDCVEFYAEKTQRSFLFQTLQAVVCDDVECFIWLIDRGHYDTQEYETAARAMTFYDCHDEYIEVDCDCYWGIYESAPHFIRQLGELANVFLADSQWGGRGYESDTTSFFVSEHIGILVPRGMID